MSKRKTSKETAKDFVKAAITSSKRSATKLVSVKRVKA